MKRERGSAVRQISGLENVKVGGGGGGGEGGEGWGALQDGSIYCITITVFSAEHHSVSVWV